VFPATAPSRHHVVCNVKSCAKRKVSGSKTKIQLTEKCLMKNIVKLKNLWFSGKRITLQYNERFGAMAGVTPLNILCELGR